MYGTKINKYSYFSTLKYLFLSKSNKTNDLIKEELDVTKISFKIFFIISRITNISLWSIGIGIISGVAVNLFTNNSLNCFYKWAIIVLILSLIFIILILRVYEDFNNRYDELFRGNSKATKPVSLSQLWQSAIKFTPSLKRFFLQNIVITMLLLFGSLVLITFGNDEVRKTVHTKENKFNDSLSLISNSQSQVITELRELSDSLEVLKKQNKLLLNQYTQSTLKKVKK